MRGVDARTPAGTVWTVRRRWLPHREGRGVEQRLRNDRTDGGLDVLEPAFGPIVLDLGIAGVVIGIVVFVALGIVLVFGWPLILLGLDLAWLIAVAGVGAIARLVLRRPWRVEAVAGGERRQCFVQGFRAAGRHRDEVARQFEHGLDPASGADTLTR